MATHLSKKIVLLSIMTSIFSLHPKCDPSFYSIIETIENTDEPYSQLLNLFNNATIETFVGSDNLVFVKKGLPQEPSKWDQLLECTHAYIRRAIKEKNAPQEYARTLRHLEEFNKSIKEVITSLHTTYKDRINSKLSEIDNLNLTQIKTKLEKLEKTLTQSSSELIKDSTSSLPLPDDYYLKSDTLPLKKIFPNYEQFFKKYQQALSYFGTSELTSKQLNHFLYSNKILVIDPKLKNKSRETQYRYTEENFYNKLEKFAHALDREIEKRGSTKPQFRKKAYQEQTKKLEKLFKDTQSIMETMVQFDTQIIPNFYVSRLPYVQDIPTIMLIGEINNMLGIVEQTIITINTLLQGTITAKG